MTAGTPATQVPTTGRGGNDCNRSRSTVKKLFTSKSLSNAFGYQFFSHLGQEIDIKLLPTSLITQHHFWTGLSAPPTPTPTLASTATSVPSSLKYVCICDWTPHFLPQVYLSMPCINNTTFLAYASPPNIILEFLLESHCIYR